MTTTTPKVNRATLTSQLVSWAPLVVSLAVFCQLYANGYMPALANSQRLEREETTMQARWGLLTEETRNLEDERRMLEDEIYRERVRRTLHDPRQQTLTLERARALAHPEKQLEDL